jgi:carbonic anhydrase
MSSNNTNKSSLTTPTLFAAVINSIALGYLYFQTKRKRDKIHSESLIKKRKDSDLKKLIDGNHIHCQKRKKPIAVVITKNNVNVEEIFQMFDGELFVIRDCPDSTSYELASQIEYAIVHLGIKTIFTLTQPNDQDVLRFINVYEEKFDKKVKYALQDTAQELLHNIINTFDLADTEQLKFYYAVYDQKTGEVRFFHYDEVNASNKINNNEKNNLKDSFVLYDETSKLKPSELSNDKSDS